MTILVNPNDPAIIYSPYNWLTQSNRAMTINAGAYFRTLVSGNSCTLHFDLTGATSASQIYYRIDKGPWRQQTIAATVTCTMEGDTDTWNFHVLEIGIKAAGSILVNRWDTQENRIVLTSIEIDTGASVRAPVRRQMNILFYGDSILEGLRALKINTNEDAMPGNDALCGWAYEAGVRLGAEFGIVGFGGTGLNVSGAGYVPALPQTYNKLWSGQARSFDPAPDFIVINEGTNDGLQDTKSAGATVVNGLLAACPAAKIVLLRPFYGNYQNTNLQYVAANCNDPKRVIFVDTDGWWNAADASDNLHPFGFANTQLIAPRLVQTINGLRAGQAGRPRQVSMFA